MSQLIPQKWDLLGERITLLHSATKHKGIRSALPKNKCYLCVEKEHQRDNEQPKYTVSAAKKQETESGLMLFYFTPMTKLHDPYSNIILSIIQLIHTPIPSLMYTYNNNVP